MADKPDPWPEQENPDHGNRKFRPDRHRPEWPHDSGIEDDGPLTRAVEITIALLIVALAVLEILGRK